MFSLIQSVRASGSAGEPLPVAFQTLAEQGWAPRRGQLNLVVAGPGTGKSAFALNQAVQTRVPTLYVSADSNAHTQLSRAIAIAHKVTYDQAAELVLSGDLSRVEDVLSGIPLRLIFDGSPNLDRLQTTMEAYEEVYGDYPDLVIVDNLLNIRAEGAGEEEGQTGTQSVLKFLHTMTRETESCVMALHHTIGMYNNANKPIALDGVKGQHSDDPEVVLTLHRPETDEWSTGDTIGVSIVKNRGGRADASGSSFIELEFDAPRMLIRDKERV